MLYFIYFAYVSKYIFFYLCLFAYLIVVDWTKMVGGGMRPRPRMGMGGGAHVGRRRRCRCLSRTRTCTWTTQQDDDDDAPLSNDEAQ